MSSSIRNPQRTEFIIPIHCPNCGQDGHETWEENTRVNVKGPQSQFISRSPGFTERLGKNDIEVVCQACGTVLPA